MTDIIEDFVPAKPANFTEGGSGTPRLYPVPKAGSRRARLSVIVDIGMQAREDIYKTPDNQVCKPDAPGAVCHPQKPAKQVVVFADLVNDVVDYGPEIGKQQYRLLLNSTFNGKIKGIVHATNNPPKDGKGNTIKGGVWTMHPNNVLSKLAVAMDKKEVLASGAINRLLDGQFMANTAVTETDSGKLDNEGEPIIYRNVNYKGAAPVAMVETEELDADGNPVEKMPEFAALKQPLKCITFTNAKKEDIAMLRRDVIAMIKLASDYAGSNMQKAIEAHEADKPDNTPAEVPADKVKPAPAPKPKPTPKPAPTFADMDDDVPF